MYYHDGKIANDMTLGGNASYGLPAALLRGLSTIDVESISAFGQLRWEPSEMLEIAGGARWTHEKRDLTVFNRLTNLPTVLAPGSDHISSSNWSPEFTITFKPSDTLTVFAALKQAYKSGSFNIVTPPGTGTDKHFNDEKVQGGEIGMKSRFMDRALSLDVAGYYYRYRGLQTGVNQPSANGLPVLATINAGKAQVYGIDFELKYRPPTIDGLNFHLAANWNKTKFLELKNVPCWGGQLISQGCNQFFNATTGRFTSQDLTGNPFVRAPEWQVTFGADYEMPLGGGMKLGLGIDNNIRPATMPCSATAPTSSGPASSRPTSA